jgi:hypothetical protein
MPTKTVKISEENYKWLTSVSGQIQSKIGTAVSIDKAISVMRTEDLKIIAGGWNISEEEAEELMKEIRMGWKRWKIPASIQTWSSSSSEKKKKRPTQSRQL